MGGSSSQGDSSWHLVWYAVTQGLGSGAHKTNTVSWSWSTGVLSGAVGWCLSRRVQIISRTRASRVTTVTPAGVDATAASTGPRDDMAWQWLRPQAGSCSVSTVWGWWVKVPTLTPDGSCRAEASCPQWWPIKATCQELWHGAQRSSSMAEPWPGTQRAELKAVALISQMVRHCEYPVRKAGHSSPWGLLGHILPNW